MKDNTFEEEDREGLQTLETIAKAEKFNKWMFETVRPLCRGRILEIGSGIGNISQYFLQEEAQMMLSDIRTQYCTHLRKKFAQFPTLEEVVQMDLTDPEFEDIYSNWKGSFDTVFALNVVEHIQDDALAVKNCRFLLKEGGILLILVPAYQMLYNTFDKTLGHFRRYTRQTLTALFKNGNFDVIHAQYFNALGMLGWVVSGTIMGKRTIPSGQMDLYNTMVPVFKGIDKLIFHSMGLSVIVAGRK